MATFNLAVQYVEESCCHNRLRVHSDPAGHLLPTYEELKQLHAAAWAVDGWAYQVFAPASHHVNIHSFALHLWGLASGAAVLPEFGSEGTI